METIRTEDMGRAMFGAMQELLEQVLPKAMLRIKEQADLVSPPNVDESTFRSYVLAEIMKASPTAECQTEWKHFDLLVQRDGVNALVEFKFYFTRRTRPLDGSHGGWKGGPSPKNEREFAECVVKLR